MARKKRRPSEKASPDSGLAREQFPGLNATFYKMSPHDYFLRRLGGLLLWLGNPDGLQQALSEGFSAGGVEVEWTKTDDEAEAEKNRKRFATAEAEVLLHHISETLLRLYFVHADHSPCPWLSLARERNFAKFKRDVSKLRERLQSGAERANLEYVFYGTSDREQFKPIPEDEKWEAACKNVARFLDHFAEHFLDAAPYNAAKHGMAVMTGESSFQLGANDDELILSKSGPAIQYLTVQDSDKGPRWSEETKWIDIPWAVRRIGMANDLIEALWQLGAARLGGQSLDKIRLFDRPDFNELERRGKNEEEAVGTDLASMITTDRMTMSLLYYEQ